MIDALLQDLRYAIRELASNRTVAGLAVLCLSLAIGTNTTVFTFVNALLLRTWDLSNRILPAAYLPYPHIPEREPRLLIRTAGDPALVAQSVRAAINAFDPAMAVLGMRTMTEIHCDALSRQETLADLLAVFGGIALLLAATGVYGVLSYFVSQRKYEIGIRAALGADQRSLVRLFVRQGMSMTLGGTVLGLAGALALARVLRGRLHELSPTYPVSFAGAAVLLIGIALVASCLPARRAASVDPLVAIRE